MSTEIGFVFSSGNLFPPKKSAKVLPNGVHLIFFGTIGSSVNENWRFKISFEMWFCFGEKKPLPRRESVVNHTPYLEFN